MSPSLDRGEVYHCPRVPSVFSRRVIFRITALPINDLADDNSVTVK